MTGCGAARMLLTSETTLCSCELFQSVRWQVISLVHEVIEHRSTTNYGSDYSEPSQRCRQSSVEHQLGARRHQLDHVICRRYNSLTVVKARACLIALRRVADCGSDSVHGRRDITAIPARVTCLVSHARSSMMQLAVNLSPHKCHNAVSYLIYSPL